MTGRAWRPDGYPGSPGSHPGSAGRHAYGRACQGECRPPRAAPARWTSLFAPPPAALAARGAPCAGQMTRCARRAGRAMGGRLSPPLPVWSAPGPGAMRARLSTWLAAVSAPRTARSGKPPDAVCPAGEGEERLPGPGESFQAGQPAQRTRGASPSPPVRWTGHDSHVRRRRSARIPAGSSCRCQHLPPARAAGARWKRPPETIRSWLSLPGDLTVSISSAPLVTDSPYALQVESLAEVTG